MKIGNWDFHGPFCGDELPAQPGVYVVATPGESPQLIDCGESENIQRRIKSHDRKACWQQHLGDQAPAFYVLISHGELGFKRYIVEKDVRGDGLPCGKQ